jgi:hypothetical protein
MRRLSVLVILFSLSTFCLSNWANALTDKKLEEINKAIQATGAKWIAGETSVSQLPEDEKANLVGVLKREIPAENLVQPRKLRSFPDSAFNWADYDGHNWMTNIKSQPCGNCWAYSTCGIIEPKMKIALNRPDFQIDLAEMYLTWCGRGACDGWYMDASFNFAKLKGIPDELCIPLGSHSCADTCISRPQRSIRITSWGAYSLPSVDEIKDKIYNSGPVSVTFSVYEDFEYYHSGVYRHVSGSFLGYHAVVISGWEDIDSAWICKNSWGTDWGEPGGGEKGGWFRIRMGHDEVGIEEAAYFVEVDTGSINWLILEQPNGGEKWMEKTGHYIKWSSPYFSDSIKLECSTDDGANWMEVKSSFPDYGNYYWPSIPAGASKNCLVKISDKATGTKSDITDGAFTILGRGDVNADGSVTITDVIFLINYLFKAGIDPSIWDLGDVTCDGDIKVDDVIYMLNYLYKGGPHWSCP